MLGVYQYYTNYCVCPLQQIVLGMFISAGVETTSYPVYVQNVSGNPIGTANNKTDYIAIWNADPVNSARGVLSGYAGPFNFLFTVKPGQTPPPFVIGVHTGSSQNAAPQVNAGADQNIYLPISSASLNGSAFDPDGTISSYLWSKDSGPSGSSFANASSASTTINGLTVGDYILRLTATDNQGNTGFDLLKITVNAAVIGNIPPTANAGPDKAITAPASSVTVNGSGTDPDGTIASYLWTKISGPSSYAFLTHNQASTVIANLVPGIYVFRLTVTDNQGATGFDDVQVTVTGSTTISFDTTLAFNITTSVSLEGVTGTVAAVDAGAMFEFNKATAPITGTPMSMNINVAGTLVCVVDFPSDYLGQQCRFRKTGFTQTLLSFTNGTVNL